MNNREQIRETKEHKQLSRVSW